MKWLSTTLALLGLFLWTAQALEVQIVSAPLLSSRPPPPKLTRDHRTKPRRTDKDAPV